MDELAREYIVSYFDKTLRIFGDRPEALGWTGQGQDMHYASLLDVHPDINGKKVLDFGCGKGDFCRYLRDRGIKADYTGLDINERLIVLAREKHPDAAFRIFDPEHDCLDEEFDYVFLCGVFNLKVQGIDDTIKQTLTMLFDRCRIALAFNALSAHTLHKDFELHYSYPGELLRFSIEHLSPFVSLRHDRMKYDFTLFIYRERHAF